MIPGTFEGYINDMIIPTTIGGYNNDSMMRGTFGGYIDVMHRQQLYV